jgi:hypothetical protein
MLWAAEIEDHRQALARERLVAEGRQLDAQLVRGAGRRQPSGAAQDARPDRGA